MTNYAYNDTIPAANNNPSADQPLMLQNFQSIEGLIGTDHVTFSTNNGGQHLQVNYTNISTQSAPTDPQSVSYTANDSASHPNNYFKNSQGTFQLSCVKAFGVFGTTLTTGGISLLNSLNVASASYSASVYSITLASNVVSGNNIVVLITTSSRNLEITYSFSNPILNISISGNALGNFVNFTILQA